MQLHTCRLQKKVEITNDCLILKGPVLAASNGRPLENDTPQFTQTHTNILAEGDFDS